MKQGECFKINSIEELKKAYYMFEDEWHPNFNLKNEIVWFNRGARYVNYRNDGIYLGGGTFISYYTEIKSPLINVNNLNKLI